MEKAFLQRVYNKVVWNSGSGGVQQRATLKNPPSWLQLLLGSETESGERVNEDSALKLHAVYVCNKILSETIASIPKTLLVRSEKSRVQADGHGAFYLVKHRPNPHTNAYDFWSTIMLHRNTWGNGYAKITFGRNGQPARFDIMKPWEVQVKEDPETGELFYSWKGQTFLGSEVLHFKAVSIDGKIGVSPIGQVREVFGLAQKQQKYISRVFGIKPPGYFSTEQVLKGDQIKQIGDSWNNATTNENLGSGTPFLNGGTKYNPLFLPPGDSQYIQSRGVTEREIYGIFRISPVMAQNYETATYNNPEHQDLAFVKHTITPIVVSFEQELNTKLLTPTERKSGLYFKSNLNSLLRGDIKTRQEFYRTMQNTGTLSANEVRELEDLDPFEGGDRRYIQGAMIPIDKVDEFIANKTPENLTKPEPNE